MNKEAVQREQGGGCFERNDGDKDILCTFAFEEAGLAVWPKAAKVNHGKTSAENLRVGDPLAGLRTVPDPGIE